MKTISINNQLSVTPGLCASQVGGNLIRVTHRLSGKAVLLDAGLSMADDLDPYELARQPRQALETLRSRGLLPPESYGVFLDEERGDQPEGEILAVLLSHAHPDHWGVLPLMHPQTSVYVSRPALRYLRAMFAIKGLSFPTLDWRVIESGRWKDLGPFRFRGVGVEHSAWGPLAYEVEVVGGPRLVYTGDFRDHGLSDGLAELLSQVNPEPDLLISEATSLGFELESEKNASRYGVGEAELGQWVANKLRAASGLVTFSASGAHPARLRVLARAARQAGRELVIDQYSAYLLAEVEGPEAFDAVEGLGGAKILWSRKYRNQVQAVWGEAKTQALMGGPRGLKPRDLRREPERWLLFFRTDIANLFNQHHRDFGLPEMPISLHLHSLWSGYWGQNPKDKVEAYLRERGVAVETHAAHVSGHASPAALRRLIKELRPKQLLPVHSLAPERLRDMFSEAGHE